MRDFNTNPEVIKHYKFLDKLGVFEIIDTLAMEIKTQHEIIEEASGLFSQKSIEELLGYIMECLNEKFIPSKVIFAIDQTGDDKIKTVTFKNLKKTESTLTFSTLKDFELFFRKYPNTISFELLEYQLDNNSITDPIKESGAQLVVPIIGINGLYGIILFGNKVVEGDYSDIELLYIDTLMKFTSVAIQNNIHYYSSVTDKKTGLFNHGFFVDRLKEEMSRSSRYGVNFSLLVIDIDHFKSFNDMYGHLAGDEVLISLAGGLKQQIREGDIAARFGGEEFFVLLHQTSKTEAFIAAERIRKVIESMVVSYGGNDLRITVSIGVSTFNHMAQVDEKMLIKQADAALYKSKNDGRNKSTVHNKGLLIAAMMQRPLRDLL